MEEVLLGIKKRFYTEDISKDMPKITRKTVGVLIIGNEILTGKVQDVNTFVLAKFCHETGMDMRRVEVVDDVESEIITSLKRLSAEFDYVFTSGGIGSTHDDITYESIAKGQNKTLEYDAFTLDLLQKHSRAPGDVTKDARSRMALFPFPCEIIRIPNMWVPIVVCENVYILPGVPSLFEGMLNSQKERFQEAERKSRAKFATSMYESEIAGVMGDIQKKYSQIQIGSYPQFPKDQKERKVVITVEGDEKVEVEACLNELKASIGSHVDP